MALPAPIVVACPAAADRWLMVPVQVAAPPPVRARIWPAADRVMVLPVPAALAPWAVVTVPADLPAERPVVADWRVMVRQAAAVTDWPAAAAAVEPAVMVVQPAAAAWPMAPAAVAQVVAAVWPVRAVATVP